MASHKTIRLGVIGYGRRGRSLFSLCGGMADVQCTAICDADPAIEKAALTAHPGVRFFADYRKLLDSGEVNAVLVETFPRAHAACSIAALERDIHVLSDVPAVHAIEEAPGLLAAAERSRAIYMLGENVNYWAFIDACLDLKREGLLGDPMYLEAEYVHNLGNLAVETPWRHNYEPIRYCTHSLGPVLKWIGQELVAVSCLDTGGRVEGDSAAHDAMVAIFRTAGNVVVKVLCCFTNRHPNHFHRYVYYGTKGYFERSSPGTGGKQKVLFFSCKIPALGGLISLPVGYALPGGSGRETHGGADRAMCADFIRAVTEGGPSPIDVRDGLRMSLPGLYALESAKRGGELVAIKYPW